MVETLSGRATPPSSLPPPFSGETLFEVASPSNPAIDGRYTREEFKAVVKGNKDLRFYPVKSDSPSSAHKLKKCLAPPDPNIPPKPVTTPAEFSLFRTPADCPAALKAVIQARGDNPQTLYDLIATNPLHLVTSSDAPVKVHAGMRYTPVHMCVLSDRPRILDAIFQILASGQLFSRQFPEESEESRARRVGYCVDLFLHLPDKQRNQTPLHMAIQRRKVEVAKVMLRHGASRSVRDKAGKTPEEYIGGGDDDSCRQLTRLFKPTFIPVFRDISHDFEPVIPSPVSSCELSFDGLSFDAANGDEAVTFVTSPRQRRRSTRISGVAGPMSPQQVQTFQTKLKTACHPLHKCSSIEDRFLQISRELNVPFSQNFDPLLTDSGDDCDASPDIGRLFDLRSSDFLARLENRLIFLHRRFACKCELCLSLPPSRTYTPDKNDSDKDDNDDEGSYHDCSSIPSPADKSMSSLVNDSFLARFDRLSIDDVAKSQVDNDDEENADVFYDAKPGPSTIFLSQTDKPGFLEVKLRNQLLELFNKYDTRISSLGQFTRDWIDNC